MVPLSDHGTAPASVSVVIPAFNAAQFIGEQIDAIRAQDEPWLDEVIVVDNRSTDGTPQAVAALAEQWAKVRMVPEPRPGGNVARNRGISESTSPAVLLCDADDVVGSGWLEALRSGLATNDLVRGRCELGRLNDPDTIAARGPVASTEPPRGDGPLNGLGGNAGVWRRAWTDLGGLAEDHYGSDDEEFFWRAHLAGLHVGYVDDALVHYRLRPGYRELFRQQRNRASNRAQLYQEFRHCGIIQRRSVILAVKSWLWLAVHVGNAVSSDAQRRGRWVRVAAQNVGRTLGSLRHAVFYP